MLITLVLYLFWFIFADRRVVFLYGHLHSTPFDFNTCSRYLMTGLVASAIVMIIYVVAGLILKKFKKKLPDYKKNWQVSSLVLVLPIFLILSVFGQPRLPILLSVAVIAILFSGLWLAYYLSDYIVKNLKAAAFTFFDSFSLSLVLSLIPAFLIFSLRKGNLVLAVIAPLVIMGLCLLWSLIMNLFFKKLKQPFNSSRNNFLFAMAFSYLIMPFFHYLSSRPNWLNYLSNMSNFLGKTWWMQVLTFLIVFGLVYLISKIRKLNDLKSLKNIFLLLMGLVIISYGSLYLVADKETDVWFCAEDTWVKIGEPNYEQPFPEECGQIDKAMGL